MSRLRTALAPSLALLASPAWLHAAAEADLLVAYDNSYASSVGGDDNAQVIIANAVAGSNAINDRSGTGARVRVAGYMQSGANNFQTSTLGGYVGWMANRDPRLTDVADRGAAIGADLVTYICAPVATEGAAAVAQQPGMYSSFGPGNFWSAIVAHELGGHNYGRSHSDGLLNPKTVMLHNYCGGGSTPPYLFTNAGLWFNGTRLIGDGNNCSQGGLINGGDNSLPSATTAQGVADRRERLITSPRLDSVVRRWSFNRPAASAPAGTAVNDSVSGAAPAVVRGVGATFTGKGLRIPGGGTGNAAASSIAAYIDLPNGILSSNTNLTLEVWATPLSNPNWGRILDFGRPVQAGDGLGAAGEYTGTPGTAAPGTTSSSDSIMLSASVGTDLSAQRFEAKLDGTAVTLDSGIPTVAGVPHLYTLTFTSNGSGGRWRWFRDGDAVAFLDVTYPLSSVEDVNNWLGRSLWSGDSMANVEYAEVRLSNVALTRDQILANYLLGPNYDATGLTNLKTSDSTGATSFSVAGQWSDSSAPASTKRYDTLGHTLRTPVTSASVAFGGQSLALSGGRLLYKGTAASTVTIPDLRASSGTVVHAGTGTFTLAGTVAVQPDGLRFHGVNGPINVSAALTGSGPVTHVGQAVTLSGANAAFTGKTLVGDGNAGTLVLDSLTRLGPSPASLVADQLSFNRGTLQNTTNLVLDDTRRGLFIDVSGATFDVATGTSVTVTSPLTSPNFGATIQGGLIRKRGSGTLILGGTTSGFNGGLYVDSGSTTANDGIVRITTPQVLANARSPFFFNNNNEGRSILQLDGSVSPITLSQSIALSGRTSANVSIQNLAGANTLGGISLNVGGAFYVLQSDSGSLRFNGPLTSVATGTRTFAFQGAGDFVLQGGTNNGSATVGLSKSGTGTLTLNSTSTHTGGTTASAGTLRFGSAGALNGGSLSVSTAATLAGLGSVAVPASVSGTHTPGAAAGTQSFTSTLTYGALSRLRWTLQGNTIAIASTGRVTATTVNVTAGAAFDLKLNDTGSTTNYFDAFWTQPRTWGALSATSQTGTFAVGTVSPDSLGRTAATVGRFALDQSATGVTVQWIPGAYATWRGTSFSTHAGVAATAAFDADPDQDGLRNGIEYLLGAAPAASSASPLTTSVADGRLRLTFPRRPTANDVTAVVQGADSPAGPWTDLASSTGGAPFAVLVSGATVTETANGDTFTVEVTDSVPAVPRRFLRLSVTQLP
jgi:autotransporter-associated beta strand protein